MSKHLTRSGLTAILLASASTAWGAGDPFFSQQWGYQNNGQMFSRSIDDIHSEPIAGQRGFDIGWAAIASRYEQTITEDMVVAVLDSGIDLDHKDLQGKIAKKRLECDSAGRLKPLALANDADGNGFAGDCMGWDFTKNSHRTYDDTGHGTHVAGIIAAVANNDIGVRGLHSKLKILPVKIIGKGVTHIVGDQKITEIFAKAIRYAVDNHADVINMSLGWPRVLDTDAVVAAIDYAYQRNVPIVAAAGNNTSSVPVFPCAHRGVLCVSSSSPDGRYSPFANYGGTIDVTAPGDQILSTFPQTMRSAIFNVDGYEFKNGTSQAAPYVSALAALIKKVHPTDTTDAIYGRIMASAAVPQGMIHYQRALEAPLPPLVKPLFKGHDTLMVTGTTATLTLPIKNFGASSSAVTLTARTDRDDIVIASPKLSLPSLAAGADVMWPLTLTAPSRDTDSMVTITVTVEDLQRGLTVSYERRYQLAMTISSLAPRDLPLPATGEFYNRQGILLLYTVSDFTAPTAAATTAEYYLAKKTPTGMTVTLYQVQNHRYEATAVWELPQTEKVLTVEARTIGTRRVHVVRSMGTDSRGKFLQQSFYERTAPLYGLKRSHWRQYPQLAVAPAAPAYLQQNVPGLGLALIPLFVATGRTPESDLENDGWHQPDNNEQSHLYYLWPKATEDGVILEERIIDKKSFVARLREQFQADVNDFADVLFAVSRSDHTQVTAVWSLGRGVTRRYVQAQFTSLTNHSAALLNTGGTNLEGMAITPAWSLRHADGATAREAWVATGYPQTTRTRQLLFTGSTSGSDRWRLHRGDLGFQHELPKDLLQGYVMTYTDGGEVISFFHSKNHLLAVYDDGTPTVLKDEVNKFSFLPGNAMLDSHYPIALKDEGATVPAIFVDETAISKNTVHVVMRAKSRDRLIKPLGLSLVVDDACQTLNPQKIGGQYHFVFACQTPSGLVLRLAAMDF